LSFLFVSLINYQEAIMKIFEQIKGKSPLFLVSAILILCAGFIIEGCGDPELKTTDSKKGQCALDFTRAGADVGVVFAGNDSFPSIAGKEVTVEAWIMPKASSTPGGIFGRADNNGILMWMEDYVPKFTVRVLTSATSTPGTTDGSVDYTVEGIALAQGIWSHIAGVLVDDDHTNSSGDGDVHGACTVAGAESQRPHLDLYVNGHFVDCATVYGGTSLQGDPDPADPAKADQSVTDPDIFGGTSDSNYATIGLADASQFEGVVDEVRLWTVARTSAQMKACMGRELSTSGDGDCGINTKKLKGYWRFNECEHAKTMDWSGAGSSGVVELGSHEWEDGWVEGVRVNGALLPMD
jgi:hypothetical protein